MSEQVCVIVGASHAGAQLALALRQEDWQGRIVLLGSEGHIPYHRPPLSKAVLAGEKELSAIYLRPEALYEKNQVEFKLGLSVTKIRRNHKTLELDNGEQLAYDKLALCLGSRVRKIPLGEGLNGVCYLRNIADMEEIKKHIVAGKHAVIIGGGYIGLETASVLSKLGMKVTVLEMMQRVLQRVTSQEISAFYTRLHSENGVSIKTSAAVTVIEGAGQVESVGLADGSSIAADLVIIGVGIVPNVELAEAAGLTVENGIVVDELAQTNDADIVAAGDCTFHPNEIYDTQLRLESVQNANDQAKTAAASICGRQKPYRALPWFWSDQYELKLQIAGLNHGYDEVAIRGDIDKSYSFAVFYFRQGKLIAADCLARPKEFMVCKRIISEGLSVSVSTLVDESVLPKDFIPA